QYQDGQAIQYTVQEDAVPGYTTQIDGTLITNSHVPKETPPASKTPKETPKEPTDPKTPEGPQDDTPPSQGSVQPKAKKVLPKTNSSTSVGLLILGLSLLVGISIDLVKHRK
ncbi:Cna B-type domain-containing protein, partial [Streptococcus cuniculi]